LEPLGVASVFDVAASPPLHVLNTGFRPTSRRVVTRMGRKSIRLAAAALAVLLAACHAAVVPISWSGTAGRSLRLVPSRLTLPAGPVALSALRGGAPSTQGIPLVEAMPTSTEDGKVTLKLSLNYGVDGGSIVVVGPSTSFGSGDINRGASPAPIEA
jgi:hypothetical protein